eukprot:5897295-Pleurochrysis_carterae.AAC.2
MSHGSGDEMSFMQRALLQRACRASCAAHHVGFEIAPPAQQLRFCELAGNAVRLEPVECLFMRL